jgi:ribosomal protein S18 acetylase RimI-like enzyme
VTGWRLRRASIEDAAALSLVAGATFLETFAAMLPGADIVAHCANKSSPVAFARWLGDDRSVVVLADHPVTSAPVGYTVLTAPDFPIPTDPGDVELKRIYTLGLTHGSGLGQALMDRALVNAAELGCARMLLGVHPENRRARRFYERAGFSVIGERVFQVGAQRITDPIYARAL